MSKFVGRTKELKLLNDLVEKSTASLAVVYGRRRIGKSRLIAEFGRRQPRFLSFTGLAPRKGMTAQSQLAEFSAQMQRKLAIEPRVFLDWGEVFHQLAQHTKTGRVVILFDEISWIGSYDPDFLGKLKTAWDEEFKENNQLILILCGSVSIWVEKNILANTGFYGRISLKLNLHGLSIKECDAFLSRQHNHLSPFEKLKILSVTGGIPKYLEEIRPEITAEENIKSLCFIDSGFLCNDYDYIFSALLQRESHYYQNIIELLSSGAAEQSEIIDHLNVSTGGIVSEILNELTVSGFITRDYVWHLKSGKIGRLSKYRLSDNYLRFFFKYIHPNIEKIKRHQFDECALSELPSWSTIMGLQIENLVLNNSQLIRECLNIYSSQLICDGAFFQHKTARQKGCQIDYMVQTILGNIFLCEIKFSRNPIGLEVVKEVQEKINRLSVPKNVAVKPVLIHASEVSDKLVDSRFFIKIINLCDFLVTER